MNKKYRFLVFTGVFVLSIILVFCTGYFRKDINEEAGRFKIELSSKDCVLKSKVATFDIQNREVSQKMLQSGKVSIPTVPGSGITNRSNQPIWLSVRVTDVKGTAKITSPNPIFDEKSECCIKPLLPGEILELKVNLDFPNEVLSNYLVSGGKIEFYDYKNNKKVGEVPLKIINSKPKRSCCSMTEK